MAKDALLLEKFIAQSACALAAWTAGHGGSHWLVARLLIGWLFMHYLEERCDVRASNIEFEPAAAGAHA